MEAKNCGGKPAVAAELGTVDIDQLCGRRVTVMGLGSFGGGVGVVRFLADRGAAIRVSDLRTREQLAQSIGELADVSDIDWRLGDQAWSHFEDADLVVVNPAVRPDNSILSRLNERGVALTTEMNLFWQQNRGRVVAVTGSNGKSTTTALIHALLQAGGQRCWLGGNIGRSLLPVVDQIGPNDWVVLELSSFQLERLNWLHARPDIAVVTNFAPNHLDWHGTLDDYEHAKRSILRWQTANDWAVLNVQDRTVASWQGTARRLPYNAPQQSFLSPQGRGPGRGAADPAPFSPADCVWLDKDTIHLRCDGSEHSVSLSAFRLRGKHNRENALAAAAAATIVGVGTAAIECGLAAFEPLPHRLQLVGEFDGRAFYNDSIATTPESAIAALDAFDEPIVLLAGGYDKQLDLSSLVDSIEHRAKAVSLLGATGPRLAEQLDRVPESPTHRVAQDFRDAIRWAVEQSAPGDVVLLSPGCASYDWFSSFADRGQQFAEIVHELMAAAESDD
ncbi:MAG: UDP-N-acetylmuramoyl-L-alanine--D-glutamate ligase [Planctomycetota bacterium]|jgi:UDP-N-acetylmuramoylalanine--D-glutamate ligase